MSPESIETALRTGTWIVAILVPVAAAWIATCWIKRSPTTVVGRWLLAGCLTFVASAWIHGRAMAPFSRAIWRCAVCDTSEYQVRFSDRVVYRTRRHASYDRNVATIASSVPHEHDRLFFESILAFGEKGCACSCDFEDGYFSCLDKAPSPEIARAMMARVASAPRERRLAMIQQFTPRNLDEPFASLDRGSTPTRERFEKDYVAWLERHPEWK